MNNDVFIVYLSNLEIKQSRIRRINKSINKLEKYALKQKRQLDSLCSEEIDRFLYNYYLKYTMNYYIDDIKYYYKFIQRNDILKYIEILKYKYTPPFLIKNLDINVEYIALLGNYSINTNNQLLYMCKFKEDRNKLSTKTKIPVNEIDKVVKLCDLTRIYAVKETRAKLYLESGLDSVEKIAKIKPQQLVNTVSNYIDNSNFKGIPTLLKEAKFTIEFAKKLPILIIW